MLFGSLFQMCMLTVIWFLCVQACGDAEYQDGEQCIGETAHIMVARKHTGVHNDRVSLPSSIPIYLLLKDHTTNSYVSTIVHVKWAMTLSMVWLTRSELYSIPQPHLKALLCMNKVSSWPSASHWDIKHHSRKTKPLLCGGWFNCL